MNDKRIKVFFDAMPLSADNVSGIGHLIAETIRAIDSDKNFSFETSLATKVIKIK